MLKPQNSRRVKNNTEITPRVEVFNRNIGAFLRSNACVKLHQFR